MPEAPFLSLGDALKCAVAILFSAALLWAGAAVAELAHGRTRRLARPLAAAGVGLVAVGIWWPSHVLASYSGMLSGSAVGFAVSLLLATLIALAVRHAADAARESASQRFGLAALVTWAV